MGVAGQLSLDVYQELTEHHLPRPARHAACFAHARHVETGLIARYESQRHAAAAVALTGRACGLPTTRAMAVASAPRPALYRSMQRSTMCDVPDHPAYHAVMIELPADVLAR